MSAPAGKKVEGQCLCGAVKFTATLKNQDLHACHCSMCRAWVSGPFLGVDCEAPLSFEDDSAVGRYSASEWGERLFCKACGTSLAWQTKGGELASVSAGLVDLDAGASVTTEIFIDEQPHYYGLAGDAKRMTGAEAFAAFTAGQEG
jgi:hypothetical protein